MSSGRAAQVGLNRDAGQLRAGGCGPIEGERVIDGRRGFHVELEDQAGGRGGVDEREQVLARGRERDGQAEQAGLDGDAGVGLAVQRRDTGDQLEVLLGGGCGDRRVGGVLTEQREGGAAARVAEALRDCHCVCVGGAGDEAPNEGAADMGTLKRVAEPGFPRDPDEGRPQHVSSVSRRSANAALALPLFVARITLVDDVHAALAANDLVAARALLD